MLLMYFWTGPNSLPWMVYPSVMLRIRMNDAFSMSAFTPQPPGSAPILLYAMPGRVPLGLICEFHSR